MTIAIWDQQFLIKIDQRQAIAFDVDIFLLNLSVRQLFLTLHVALIQTVSLFANFHVTGSVIMKVLLFWSAIFRFCKFSALISIKIVYCIS